MLKLLVSYYSAPSNPSCSALVSADEIRRRQSRPHQLLRAQARPEATGPRRSSGRSRRPIRAVSGNRRATPDVWMVQLCYYCVWICCCLYRRSCDWNYEHRIITSIQISSTVGLSATRLSSGLRISRKLAPLGVGMVLVPRDA